MQREVHREKYRVNVHVGLLNPQTVDSSTRVESMINENARLLTRSRRKGTKSLENIQ